jgi:ComF family protein
MRRSRIAVNQGGLSMVYKWLKRLHIQVFPVRCRLCLATGSGELDLCVACRADLPWLPTVCERCAAPLPAGAEDSGVCPACRATPPALARCHALFGYQAPVAQWIQDLKFNGDLTAGRLLGQLLAARAADIFPTTALLLPVPLHPDRLRQRGYNQAQEIARPLLRRGFQRYRGDCRRTRHTEAQSGLPAVHRHHNMRGAFSVGPDLAGQHILLVDDVMTTGATLNELASTLKAAGAWRVEACVIARTLKA